MLDAIGNIAVSLSLTTVLYLLLVGNPLKFKQVFEVKNTDISILMTN